MDPKEELRQEVWKRFEAARNREEERSRVERMKRCGRLGREVLQYSEWIRKLDVIEREVDRKFKAEVKELKKKCDADQEPFQKNQIIECPIITPPIQQVIPLKVNGPYKVMEISIPSPPVQKVVTLKASPARKITISSVPSQETPVQQIVVMKTTPMLKAV